MGVDCRYHTGEARWIYDGLWERAKSGAVKCYSTDSVAPSGKRDMAFYF
jgi:hypothetical protein